MIDIQFAPEIRGVQCPECGGSLVRYSHRAYCDWCQLYVRPKKEYQRSGEKDEEPND